MLTIKANLQIMMVMKMMMVVVVTMVITMMMLTTLTSKPTLKMPDCLWRGQRDRGTWCRGIL